MRQTAENLYGVIFGSFMLKKFGIVLLFVIAATGACAKTQDKINTANSSSSDAGLAADENITPENSVEKTKANVIVENPNAKTFNGKITDGRNFEMQLTRDGEKLFGTYSYIKTGENFNLSGTINEFGNLKLEETDASGKVTGKWSGSWKDDANEGGAVLKGNWQMPGDDSSADVMFFATQQIIELTDGAKIISKTIKEENREKRSEIFSVYPELTGIDSSAAAAFNALVKKRVVEMNDTYRKDLADMTAEDLKLMPAEIKFVNEVSYDVMLATNDLISISLVNYTFLGGAHGATWSRSVNYDLKNNRELKLADIFEPNSDYLKMLSDYAIADLKPRVGEMSDDEWLSKGAAPEADNYRSWNLTKKGLMVSFDQYQVAAYAAGPQTVIVPYSKLQSVLRKSGVVAELAK